MKKTLLVTGVLIFFGLIPHVFAQGFVPLAPIPGLTQGATADTTGLANFFNNLYKYLIGLAAALAVIEIIWGGLEIATKDSVSKQSEGRTRITQAILGLILVLSPVLVFTIINPSILNLSLNLPPITQSTGSTAPALAPVVPCTSNCDTGTSGAGIGTGQSVGVTLYACSDSDCSLAKKSCTDRTTIDLDYTAVVVCSTSGNIDPSGAVSKDSNAVPTACKSGESLAVNCTQAVVLLQG